MHGSGLNSTGNGAYTSGGCVINLTLADFMDDLSAARVGTDHGAFAGKSQTTLLLAASSDPWADTFFGLDSAQRFVALLTIAGCATGVVVGREVA